MGCWPNRIVSTCPHWIPPHRCDFLTHFSLASGCLTELQNTSPNNKGNNDSNNSSRRKKDSCNQSGRKLGHWGWELGVGGNAATDRKVDWVWKDFLGLYTRGIKNIPPEAICELAFRDGFIVSMRDNAFWKPRQHIHRKPIVTQPGGIRLREKETHIS